MKPKPLHQEFKRLQILDGLTIIEHSRKNVPRTHSRARENAKFALNLLLIACFITGYLSFVNLEWVAAFFGCSAFYALCYLITNKGQ